MPAKNKAFVVYPDDTTAAQIEDLRKYFSDRQGGVKISDGKIGRDLINEKHIEIVNRQNNNARITDIVNGLAELKEAGEERLAALESAVIELTEIIKGERKNV